MGAAAWKYTSSGSTPNSRKKPFSSPTNSGAEEVSLRTPTLTLSSARAEPGTTSSNAKAIATTRRIRFSFITTSAPPRDGDALQAIQSPVRQHAEERQQDDADHELGGRHD